MKKSILLFVLLTSLLSLSACGGGQKENSEESKEEESSLLESSEEESSTEESSEETSEEEKEVEEAHIEYIMSSMMTDNPFKTYKLEFDYNNEYFAEPATSLNLDLALLSYGLSLSTGTEASLKKYFEDCGFEVTFVSENYNGSTATSVSYVIAYRKVNGLPLLGVGIRGFNYGLEWSDNFNVGLEGNHAGFNQAAETIEASIESIVNQKSLSEYKLWIAGYSRGGAIANILGANLMKNDDAGKDDIYVYTFEAPRGVAEENLGDFNNIHNFVNEADLIASILPAEHHLYRAGMDINIFNPNYRDMMLEFDSSIEIPALSESYKDEIEIKDAILDRMVSEQVSDYAIADMSTRENYYNNIQPHATYLLDLFFKLKQSTLNKIKEAISKLEGLEMIGLIAEDGLYKFLEEDNSFITDDGVEFDTLELKEHLHISSALAVGPGAIALTIYLQNSTDLTDLLNMHYPELIYVLLKNFELLGE